MTREEAIQCWIIPAIENMWKKKKCQEIIKALEQESCEEYKSDLKTIIDDISKEGNQLISKKDLLRRFKEVDEEYGGMPWNLLQILANINILIGQEPCEDAVSRSAVLDVLLNGNNSFRRVEDIINELPSVLPKRGWIKKDGDLYECSVCGKQEWGVREDTDVLPNCSKCGAEMR